jgi:hypothetical protein
MPALAAPLSSCVVVTGIASGGALSFSKAEQLIALATLAAARHAGITLDDVVDRFQLSKRTAQRILRALEMQLPDALTSIDDEARKREGSGLPRGQLTPASTDLSPWRTYLMSGSVAAAQGRNVAVSDMGVFGFRCTCN